MARSAGGAWAEGAWLCLAVAVLTYTLGGLSGFDTRPARACAEERTGRADPQAHRDIEQADVVVTSESFPLSHLCTWPDGTRVELVPGWANPLLIASLVGAVVCAGTAVRAGAKARPPHPPKDQS
ncbi:hypothetical protein [Streptomyces purpureus]|nr:hypothetical protein [Streptomyces purpureus]